MYFICPSQLDISRSARMEASKAEMFGLKMDKAFGMSRSARRVFFAYVF